MLGQFHQATYVEKLLKSKDGKSWVYNIPYLAQLYDIPHLAWKMSNQTYKSWLIATFNSNLIRRPEDTTKDTKTHTPLSNIERHSKTQMQEEISSTDPNSEQVVLKMIYIL